MKLFETFVAESKTALDTQARIQLGEYIVAGDAEIPAGLEAFPAWGILRVLGILGFDEPGLGLVKRQHQKQFLRLSENTLKLLAREAAREADIDEQIILNAIQL